MDYTIIEKVSITAWVISREEESVEDCRRRFRNEFNKEAPPRQTLINWKRKLLETGTLVKDRPRGGRPATVTGLERQKQVMASINANPTSSTRRLSEELDISQTSVCRILKKNQFHPFKPEYSQFLCDGDSDRRLQFCEAMREKFREDPAFLRKITFSDECTFHLNGSVNKHNVHYWAPKNQNPHYRISSKSAKTRCLVVWACVSFNGMVAFDISQHVMNGDRYCNILRDKVVPYFIRRRQMIFQQDGASSHYCVNAREILDREMPGQWIGRRGPTEWPARSPDLTVCDFWLWSYIRSKVYTPGITFRSIADLSNRIQMEINNIPLHMFRKSFRDFEKRCNFCYDNQGGLFEI